MPKPAVRHALSLILRLSTLILVFFALGGVKACRQDYFFAPGANVGSSSSAESTSSESVTSASSESSLSLSSGVSLSSVSSGSQGSSTASSLASSTASAQQLSGVMPLLAELQGASETKAPRKTAQTAVSGQAAGGTGNWLGQLYAGNTDCDTLSSPNADSDGDGFTDLLECRLGADGNNPRSFPGYHSNDLRQRLSGVDDDMDGLTNEQEKKLGTDPYRSDTDGDGCPDGAEVLSGSNPLDTSSKPVDSDGDCLSDEYEISIGTDPFSADTDGDGLRDDMEAALHTDPLKGDTDGDGILDGKEVVLGSDPLKSDFLDRAR